jgi:2-methylisocitrate lyase-like PEP mutase family enzyme
MTRGRTASQVIGDIATLPDAYLYYLTTTAIPVLLDCDHSFGSSIAKLRCAVTQRLDHGVEDARTRAASLHLIRAMT